MGTEYALVSDLSGEAYDLGVGPWYEWTDGRVHTYDSRVGRPEDRSDIDALLKYYQESWALGAQPAWASAVGEAIDIFFLHNPDARVVADGSDAVWGTVDELPTEELASTGFFRQVGSRREHDVLLIRRDCS